MEMILPLQDFPDLQLLFGSYNRNIKLLRKAFGVDIVARDNITIQGGKDSVEKTVKALLALQEHIARQKTIDPSQVEEIISRFAGERKNHLHLRERFPVKPRNSRQQEYMKAIYEYDIVFGIGPAGTGKTFLGVAMAVDALNEGMVRKILLVRPAVEAGEKLGFLPGDYQAKIDPYLRPLYDALYCLVPYDRLKKYMERDIIEIAPLAYMRGRTLENAFIILDEAQNTTTTQMKMFLTRLGFNSKIIVTGDITQVDLPREERSGLIHARNILKEIDGVHIFYFTARDIVRHPLVQKIVEAYEQTEEREVEPAP